MRTWLLAGMIAAGGFAAWSQTAPPVYSSTDPAPTPAMTLEQRADLFMARRNYPQALALMQNAVKHKQATPALYNRMGIASEQMLNFRQAGDFYKKAIKGDHKAAPYVNNLGTVYYEQHKYKDAAKQFRAAIKIEADKAPYYVNLGGAEFAQSHFQPAMTAYRQALQIDPGALFANDGVSPIVRDISEADSPRYHYDLSRIMCSLGLMDDAVHQFRRAYEEHYTELKRSLTDPVFAPLRARPEYQAIMGTGPNAGGGIAKVGGV